MQSGSGFLVRENLGRGFATPPVCKRQLPTLLLPARKLRSAPHSAGGTPMVRKYLGALLTGVV